jgi:hypothetical protein
MINFTNMNSTVTEDHIRAIPIMKNVPRGRKSTCGCPHLGKGVEDRKWLTEAEFLLG